MEIKKGYKQTELGEIPEDWEVKTLKELSSLITKGTTPKRFTNSGVNYIKIESLESDEINLENCLFIDDITHKTDLKRSILNEGDLLFAIAGATIGKCTIVPKEVIPANTNQALAIIRLKEDENKMYVFYFLKSSLMQKYVIDNIAGGAQPNLNLAQVGGYCFPLPPTKAEQTAIATALSDMDNLINSLATLIVKKKAIKQGAMQELLKPKEGWVLKKLTDIVDYIHGKAHEQDIVEDGEYIVVNSKFVSTEGSVVKYSNVNKCTARKNDVLTVLSDLPNGKALAKCFFVEHDKLYAVNQRICIWRSKGSNPRFLFYLLNRHKYFLSLDDGVSQTHILNHHLEKFQLEVPVDIEEQNKIGKILLDMDNEIQSLEQNLSKYQMLKQGMMQELLTGKTRLI